MLFSDALMPICDIFPERGEYPRRAAPQPLLRG